MRKLFYTLFMTLQFLWCGLLSLGQTGPKPMSLYQMTLEEYIKIASNSSDKGEGCFALDTNNVKDSTLYVVIDSHDHIDSIVHGFRIICINLDFNWQQFARDRKDRTSKREVLVIELMKIENQNLILSVGPETLTKVDENGNHSYWDDNMTVCPTFQFVYNCQVGNWVYEKSY